MSLLSDLRRRAVTRGLFGGSRPWLLLGIAAWTVRGLQWALRPAPTTVYRRKLDVGESIIIRHDPAPPTRRQRRKLRRSEKRQMRRDQRKAVRD